MAQRNLDPTAAPGNRWQEAGAGNNPPATRGRAGYLNDQMENQCRQIEATGQELVTDDFNQQAIALVLAAGLKPQGLQLTWVDASNLTIGPGHVVDALRQRIIQNPADLTKDITADWALGAAAGAMPATVAKTGQFTTVGTAVTGIAADLDGEFKVGDVLWSSSNAEGRRIDSISGPNVATIESAFSADVAVAENVQKNGLAPRTWYHLHLLAKDDATGVDWGLDTDIDATNLLADAAVITATLTRYRRIATPAYSPDGVGFWHIIQTGRRFQLPSGNILDIGTVSNVAVTTTLPVPILPSLSAEILFSVRDLGTSNSMPYGLVSSLAQADVAVDANVHNFRINTGNDSESFVAYTVATATQNVRTRFSLNDINAGVSIYPIAWHDPAEA